ncbi:MAG: phosphoenolpyruvate synthase [Ignavibacteriales bacterium]|nr:phosphoenolpyruvate synthase [Ignavibacteriales bacterium]
MHSRIIVFLFFILLISYPFLLSHAQAKTNDEIKELVQKFKTQSRGPYKAIRWFCPDGSTVPPDQRCPEPGGVQRAQYKDEVVSLAKTNKIYLGQILSATKLEDFLDEQNQYSRLKQYQIESYLKLIDNGWVNQKAKFYRGAIQVEDEQNWGRSFLQEILAKDKLVSENFYLIRSAANDIPHKGDTKNAEKVRAISKTLSDTIPSFMSLRVKLHGNPEEKDIQSVKQYVKDNNKKLTEDQKKEFVKLVDEMNKMYAPIELGFLTKLIKPLPKDSEVKTKTQNFINSKKSLGELSEIDYNTLSDILLKIRTETLKYKKGNTRLDLLDLSLTLENILFTELNTWAPKTLSELLKKNYCLAQTLAGIGNLELWEWEKVKLTLTANSVDKKNIDELIQVNELSKRIIEWSANMIRSTYGNELNLFLGFEPIAHGFIDDKIRASVLLFYGNTVSQLNEFVMKEIGQKNEVLNLANQNQIKGLNPGYAKGELVVIKGLAEDVEFKSDKIYAFEKPLADLKPVAGLLTVSEGNLISHIQLLARNLGIPNATLSQESLDDLMKFNGKKVFYAVSRKGKVIMKLEKDMTEIEKNLFAVKKEITEIFNVPTDKLKLNENKLIDLRKLKSKDSGVLCGPKAANLGQLKSMFPDNVVEGFVIPFGTFKEHMNQMIPGKSISYWKSLNDTFTEKRKMEKVGKSEKEIEDFTLAKLKELQALINEMPLLPNFVADLKNNFSKIFAAEIGKIGVFLRSDTNMEDLKDFTGAGLNLTLFNIQKKEEILKGIKQVWASPFSERSYRWRQKILQNPENVYPSILVIPGVNVDCSGVMITTGVTSNNEKDVTVAFNRGVGGAVEGQQAESYLIKDNGSNILISPSRENKFTVLNSAGGTSKEFANFQNRILSEENINQLFEMSKEIKTRLPNTPGVESSGPFDVELGFKDSKIWLFQVRPFVENKRAASSNYINSLDAKINSSKKVNLNIEL